MNARNFFPLFLISFGFTLQSNSCSNEEEKPAGAKADSMVNAILDESSKQRKADSLVAAQKAQRLQDSLRSVHSAEKKAFEKWQADSARIADSLAQTETDLPQDGRKHPPPLPLEPRYKEGRAAMEKFLAGNVRYPEAAKKAGVKGIVHVGFVVQKDGKLKDFKVLRGLGYGCDEEALRVVKLMPPWEPGRMGSKPMEMEYNVAVKFGAE